MKRAVFLSVLVLTAVSVNATIIHVPGDQPTIQAGIDSATGGDTVLVADGIYTGDGNRDIDFLGKSLVVVSESGPEFTVIDCQGSHDETHRGFRFTSGEDSAAIVDGFTITGGFGPPEDYPSLRSANRSGGAIYCRQSSPTVKNCVFVDNFAVLSAAYPGGRGGAVCCLNSSLVLRNCRFNGNMASNGGGLSAYSSAVTVENCVFTANVARSVLGFDIGFCGLGGAVLMEEGAAVFVGCVFQSNRSQWIKYSDYMGYEHFIQGHGGAIYTSSCSTVVNNCTFSGNTADSSSVDDTNHDGGAGIFFAGSPIPAVENCIVAYASDGAAISSDGLDLVVACCDVYGNAAGDWVGAIAGQNGINGNFSLDPLFCDTANGDFRVAAYSPCAPWNNECGILIGALEPGCGCCVGGRGDANYDASLNVADLTYLVDFLFFDGPAPPCTEEGDVDGSEAINVADLSYLVEYLFFDGPAPAPCP